MMENTQSTVTATLDRLRADLHFMRNVAARERILARML
jgi:hypothetical protein